MIHLVFLALAIGQPDVAVLKKEARALSKPDGCARVVQCKTMPLGSKSCGGPSEFLVFCATSTDEKALSLKAAEATEAEKAKNAGSQMMGICTALTAPKLTLDENGKCAAVQMKSADQPM